MRYSLVFVMALIAGTQSYAKEGICELYAEQGDVKSEFIRVKEQEEDTSYHYIAKAGEYTATMVLSQNEEGGSDQSLNYLITLKSSKGLNKTAKGRLSQFPYDGAWWVFNIQEKNKMVAGVWCKNLGVSE